MAETKTEKCMKREIKRQIEEGKPQKQAVAIAARKCGLPKPSGKK